jgi:hypothetical protein
LKFEKIGIKIGNIKATVVSILGDAGAFLRKVVIGRVPSLILLKGIHTVRKNAAHKESSQEKSHIQEQGLMEGSNCQAGWGKMVQPRLWSRYGFCRRGRLRTLAHA